MRKQSNLLLKQTNKKILLKKKTINKIDNTQEHIEMRR